VAPSPISPTTTWSTGCTAPTIGIPPEHQSRIFERFERAVSERHYGGLGLGLFISQEIVRAHGGLIGVDSAPGVATTFTVELPLAKAVH
jgi:signal transduction histidine kinase